MKTVLALCSFLALSSSSSFLLTEAFVIPTSTPLSVTPLSRTTARSKGLVSAGLFDGFFAENERRKQEDYERQQEILRNRQDPNKQQKYFQEVNARRREASQKVNEKFNLSKGGKQDPAIKWMELRKQGKIKDREKYEQYGETNRGIVIPQVPFGNAKYDQGERFDLRLPYVDEGYVDESASLGNTFKRLFGFGKASNPTTLPKGPGSDGPGAKGNKKM